MVFRLNDRCTNKCFLVAKKRGNGQSIAHKNTRLERREKCAGLKRAQEQSVFTCWKYDVKKSRGHLSHRDTVRCAVEEWGYGDGDKGLTLQEKLILGAIRNPSRTLALVG